MRALAELLREVWEVIEPLPGWCDQEKSNWIAKWVYDEKPTLMIELGVFGGRSLLAMALPASDNNDADPTLKSAVYGIDPYTAEAATEGVTEPEHLEWWSKENLKAIRDQCIHALEEEGLRETVVLWECRSDQVVSLVEDGTVDLLHIDANHSELASCRDVTLWLPKVRAGGVIVIDDVDWLSVQMARALLKAACKLLHRTKTWEVFQTPLPGFLIV